MAALKVINEAGKGRAFIILHETGQYSAFSADLFDALSKETRVILVQCEAIGEDNWLLLSEELRQILNDKAVRQASFVSFGGASTLVLNLTLQDLKLTRSIVLVDAATRSHPTMVDRIADKIENYLPLGLPLRSNSKSFDAKSFLQRVRCPVLNVVSPKASDYVKTQLEVFKRGLPTGWALHIDREDQQVSKLNQAVLEFQKVAAKCPQKAK